MDLAQLSGGILGSVLGGVFRLAPEVLSILDKKNERAHELQMFDKQVELQKFQGDLKIREVTVQQDGAIDQGVMTALKAAVDQQVELVKSVGSGWFSDFIKALSASVRPVVTYWILAVWSGLHVWVTWKSGTNAAETFKLVMTPDFLAMVGGIINYWFLDRTLSKRRLS